jgi:predicted ATPase
MRPDLPSGTVTFLFTDVEGSTKLLDEIGDEAYDEALAEHRRIVRAACSAQGGVEVDTQGDAFFVAFPTAPGALAAASEMTSALAQGPIRVRIGLHTGTPRLSEEGYVGKEVHFAARVAATGHGGQIVLSKATADLVESSLTDLGEHRLKDIAEPIPIYQLGEESFPPLKTISNTNLPRPASSFVGRERELEEVLQKVSQGARLLTVTGPGGSGKTRLALEAATSLVPSYKAGVFWVGLASLRDPALVTETISQTLGAKDGLAAHIAERELLLLLDNLEQVVEAAPELSQLLQACPNLTLLCTSRELLRISGEIEYPVPPLASSEAVELFCARSQLDASEEVEELCRRLDSLPLAVELAAARTKALTPTQILERLSQRLDLLKGGRDADPRQQTLRATIEWSYDLLSEEEQRLFRSLSIFSGGCTLEAAEEVAGADLDTQQSLVEKSLLRFSGERYWMLETMREYAGEKLKESGQAEDLRQRHAEYFAVAAERAARRLMYETDLLTPVRWFQMEHENLRSAINASETQIELRLRLLHAIRTYWDGSGFGREYRVWIEAALAESDPLPAAIRARALANAGWIANVQQDPEAGVVFHERSLDLYRSLGDDEGVGRSLVGLGRGLRELGRTEEARDAFERGLHAARKASSAPVTLGAGSSLAFMALAERDLESALQLAVDLRTVDTPDAPIADFIEGLVALEQGNLSTAGRLLTKSLANVHSTGMRAWLPADLDALAAVLAASGEAERAATLVGQSQALRASLGVEPEAYTRLLQNRVAEAARKELGDERFSAATAQGASMELDDVVAYALASVD